MLSPFHASATAFGLRFPSLNTWRRNAPGVVFISQIRRILPQLGRLLELFIGEIPANKFQAFREHWYAKEGSPFLVCAQLTLSMSLYAILHAFLIKGELNTTGSPNIFRIRKIHDRTQSILFWHIFLSQRGEYLTTWGPEELQDGLYYSSRSQITNPFLGEKYPGTEVTDFGIPKNSRASSVTLVALFKFPRRGGGGNTDKEMKQNLHLSQRSCFYFLFRHIWWK